MSYIRSVDDIFQSFTENAAVTELRDACRLLESRIEALSKDPEKTDVPVAADPKIATGQDDVDDEYNGKHDS